MKRMYVTLTIIFCLFLWAAVGLGQKVFPDKEVSGFDRMKRRMELREEMHRRMMNKLLNGVGPDQDLFKDMEQMFEDSMADSFSNFDNLPGSAMTSSNFEMSWEEGAEGRTLLINPTNKDQQLDIDVSKGAITIKGKNEVKTANGSSVSSFSNIFSVPGDCDETKVKIDQKDGKILVSFPYKESKKNPAVKMPDRVPVPPSEGDVTI